MSQNILKSLPNKPLVEALFEFKWGPETPEMLGYPIVVGALYEKLKSSFPEIEDLPLNRVPLEMTSYMVRQRFRKAKDGWPLVQIGPGVLTVNETEGYETWEQFRDSSLHVLEMFNEAHPQKTRIVPRNFMLRYINALEFDFDKNDVLVFLASKLKTNVGLDKKLFDVGESSRSPGELILRLSFPLGKPKGSVIIQFSSGLKDDKPALIWELIVNSSSPATIPLPTGVENWLKDAHDVIEHWFLKLAEGELLESFNRKPQ